MWDVLVRTPRGSNNPRKLSMLLATFFVACFGYIFLTSQSVNAVDDTKWDGDNIVYAGNTYTPTSSDTELPVDIPEGSTVYNFIDTSKTPNIVNFIYFSAGTDNPKSAKEATYIQYTLNPPPDVYTNPTGEKKIPLTPSEPTTTNKDDGTLGSSCTISGIGWVVCPIMNGVAEGMDFIYERIRGFLSVQPLSFSNDNPVYRIWVYSRDLANVAFIIGFLVIIYSYLVGGGFSGYEIRKIIPRLVIAAVLINVSYVICATAVDISNIAGYGVNQLFENVRDNVLAGSSTSGSINWTSVTTWVLAGGTGAVAGGVVLNGAIGGAAGGLWFMLAPFLLGAALLVMVTFLILAARQAIIVIAIGIAPLAFAAYILPNTEKWFERWRSLFVTMLLMFPAFGAVFGGAELAGEVIIRTAAANGSIEQVILGLGVMVAPLAITPLLLKLGGGVMNRIGGIVNNQQKGLYDRYKNYNKERLGDHVAKNNARNAEMRANGGFSKRQFMRRRAAYDYSKKSYRENQRKSDEEAAQNSWHTQSGRWGYDNSGQRGQRSRFGTSQDGFGNLDTYKRDNQLNHNQTEAHHEEHWQQLLQRDPTRRGVLTNTRLSEGRGKVMSGAMEAQDERTFQTALNTNAGYAGLRAMKVQTSVDSGAADIHKATMEAAGKLALSNAVQTSAVLQTQKIRATIDTGMADIQDAALDARAKLALSNTVQASGALQANKIQTAVDTGIAAVQDASVDARGKLALSNTVNNDRALRTMKVDTFATEKQAETIDNTLQRNAEANWNYISRTNDNLQELRLREVQATDKAKKVEEQWNSLVENIAAKGSEAPNLAAGVGSIADSIKSTRQDIQMEGFVQESAKRVAQANMSTELKTNATLRAYGGGVGGQEASNRIYAKARADIVKATLDDITASRSVLTEYSLNELINLHQNHNTRDGQPASDAMIDAAMQEILLAKGNNWAFQKTKDYIASRGMHYDETTNKYYEDAARTIEITDQTEIERRRDEQQLFVDSVKNSKLAIKSLSGTDRGDLETGTFTMSSSGAIHRDIRDQKINATRLAETDIDELMRMVQVLRDDGVRGSLSPDQRQGLIDQIAFATDPNNPQISGRIAQREKEMMGVIAQYLGNATPMTDAQKWAIESVTQTPVPTRFVPGQPYKKSAAFSGSAADEPYGPDGRIVRR